MNTNSLELQFGQYIEEYQKALEESRSKGDAKSPDKLLEQINFLDQILSVAREKNFPSEHYPFELALFGDRYNEAKAELERFGVKTNDKGQGNP